MEALILRLPEDKMVWLQALLASWGSRKSCSRKELESLIGHLNHACKVVRSGRAFLRRMIDLLHSVHRLPQSKIPIHLNAGFQSDLAWWQEFMFIVQWKRVSFLPNPPDLPVVHLASDASGTWGCWAWHGRSWFQVQWDTQSQSLSIAAKELLPIILACAMWGHQW